MHRLGLRPFCKLRFCASILSTFLRLIPMDSQASCRNSVLLIDLLRPADQRFSSYSGLDSLAQFRPLAGALRPGRSGRNRLNGLSGG
jgi:hypothetical protein